MPSVTLKRDSGFADGLRSYELLIDGAPHLTLRNGESATVELPVGTHSIEARLDWQRSAPVTFVLGDTDRTFNVRSTLRGWRLILALPAIFIPGAWISIKECPSSVGRPNQKN